MAVDHICLQRFAKLKEIHDPQHSCVLCRLGSQVGGFRMAFYSRNQFAIGGFLVGAAVGAGGCYLWVTKSQPVKKGTGIPDHHHAFDFGGLPQTEALRFKQGFIAAFDYRTRSPKWVLEHITEDTANGNADRKGTEFFEDKDIESWLRSKLDDYRGSGYDRGHMAPAADFKGSQTAMDETFSMCNISPQVGEGFNRDYWARLEKFVKDCTKKFEDVYIVTGPLWMPTVNDNGKWQMKYNLIGQPPSLLSVPTHFYKVVITKGPKQSAKASQNSSQGKGMTSAKSTNPDDYAAAAFVMPNAPIDPDMPLSAFVVPLEPLEAVAGVNDDHMVFTWDGTRFFPGYISRDKMLSLDYSAQQIRGKTLDCMKVIDQQAVIDKMHPQLLLSAPSSSNLLASAASTDNLQLTVKQPQPVSLTTTTTKPVTLVTPAPPPPPKVKGCSHLCDVIACELPAERFWERSNSSGSSNLGRSSSGNYRTLNRR